MRVPTRTLGIIARVLVTVLAAGLVMAVADEWSDDIGATVGAGALGLGTLALVPAAWAYRDAMRGQALRELLLLWLTAGALTAGLTTVLTFSLGSTDPGGFLRPLLADLRGPGLVGLGMVIVGALFGHNLGTVLRNRRLTARPRSARTHSV